MSSSSELTVDMPTNPKYHHLLDAAVGEMLDNAPILPAALQQQLCLVCDISCSLQQHQLIGSGSAPQHLLTELLSVPAVDTGCLCSGCWQLVQQLLQLRTQQEQLTNQLKNTYQQKRTVVSELKCNSLLSEDKQDGDVNNRQKGQQHNCADLKAPSSGAPLTSDDSVTGIAARNSLGTSDLPSSYIKTPVRRSARDRRPLRYRDDSDGGDDEHTGALESSATTISKDFKGEDVPTKREEKISETDDKLKVPPPKNKGGKRRAADPVQWSRLDDGTTSVFQCAMCPRQFQYMASIKAHVVTHTGERPFVCHHCGSKFALQSTLSTHLRTHSTERPYKCDTCGKRFSEKAYLVKHNRVHTGEKPYCCELCGKTFKESHYLSIHRRFHSGEKPYSCDKCNQQFTTMSNLKKHLRGHDGLGFCCEECGRMFRDHCQLRNHMRTHTGERPFSCNECGMTFTMAKVLARHQRLHSGEKPYKCSDCGKCFGRADNLKDHMKEHAKAAAPTSAAPPTSLIVVAGNDPVLSKAEATILPPPAIVASVGTELVASNASEVPTLDTAVDSVENDLNAPCRSIEGTQMSVDDSLEDPSEHVIMPVTSQLNVDSSQESSQVSDTRGPFSSVSLINSPAQHAIIGGGYASSVSQMQMINQHAHANGINSVLVPSVSSAISGLVMPPQSALAPPAVGLLPMPPLPCHSSIVSSQHVNFLPPTTTIHQQQQLPQLTLQQSVLNPGCAPLSADMTVLNSSFPTGISAGADGICLVDVIHVSAEPEVNSSAMVSRGSAPPPWPSDEAADQQTLYLPEAGEVLGGITDGLAVFDSATDGIVQPMSSYDGIGI